MAVANIFLNMSTTSSLRVCRGCLATDARLYDMRQDRLMEAYNNLLSTAVQVTDDLPHYLCTYCAALLLKCDAFRTKCIDSLIVLRNAKLQHFNLISEHIKILDRPTYLIQSELEQIRCVDDTPEQNYSDTYSDTDDSIDKINVNFKAKSITKDHDYAIAYKDNGITRLLKKHFDSERCLLKDFNVNIDCEASKDIIDIRDHQKRQLSEIINHIQYSSKASTKLLKILDGDLLKHNNKTSKSKSNPTLKNENEETVAQVGKGHLHQDIVQDNSNKSILEIHSDVDSVDLNAEIPCLLQNDESNIEVSQDELFVFETQCDGINEISESEEDIPIPDPKTNAKKCVPMENINEILKERQIERDKITAESFAKYNIEVKHLSKEEQIKEINDRKESDNYKNAQFKCNICFKGFVIEETYKNHMVLHDDSSGTFVCEICQCRFLTKRAWMKHQRYHSDVFTCKECGHTTKAGQAAVEHYKWHKGKMHSCDYCGKEFRKNSSKYAHIKMSHPTSEQLVRCEMCGDSFYGPTGLVYHENKSHKEMNSPECLCSGCGIQFYCSDAFKAHQGTDGLCDTIHKYCVRCGMSFETEELLKEHELEQLIPQHQFKCDVCQKVFANFTYFKRHQRSHQPAYVRYRKSYVKTKPTLRPMCDNNDPTSSGPALGLMCELCGKVSKNKTTLQTHHHNMHSNERPFSCSLCTKTFKTAISLKIHTRVHTGERPFQCERCPKAFQIRSNLDRHQLVHTGERPYSCDICGKSFTDVSYIKIHVKTVHMKEPMPPRVRRGRTRRNKNTQ